MRHIYNNKLVMMENMECPSEKENKEQTNKISIHVGKIV